MLELGVLLSSKIEKHKIDGKYVFSVAGNYLIAYFDLATDAIITKIAQSKPHYVVFRDSSFLSDSARVNFEQTFKTYSTNTKMKVLY
jgi:adenine-specific DNA-methyltransferase